MIEEDLSQFSEPQRKRRLALSSFIGTPPNNVDSKISQENEDPIIANYDDNSILHNGDNNKRNQQENFISFLVRTIFPCIFPPLHELNTPKSFETSNDNNNDNPREIIRKKWKEDQEKILKEMTKDKVSPQTQDQSKNSSKLKKKAAILIQKQARIYLAKKEADRLRDQFFNDSNNYWVEKYNNLYNQKEKDRIFSFLVKETASDFVSQLLTAGKEITSLSNQASITLQKNWRGYRARKSLVRQPTFYPTHRTKRKKISRIDSHPSSLPSRLSLVSLRRLWAKKWYEPQNSVYLHHVGPSPLDIFNQGRKLKKRYDKDGRLIIPSKKNLNKSNSQLKEEIFGPQSLMFKYQTVPPKGKKHGLRNKKIVFPSSLKNQYSMFSIQNDPMAWVAFPISIKTKEEMNKKIETCISPAVKAFLKYSPYSQKLLFNTMNDKKEKKKTVKISRTNDSQLDELIKLGYDKTDEELIRDSSQPIIGATQYDTQSGYKIMYKGNNEWEKISTGERIRPKDNYEAEGLSLSNHYSLLNEYLIDSGIAEMNGIDLKNRVLTVEPIIKFLPGGQISISAAPLTLDSFSLTGPLALISSQSNHSLNSHIQSFSHSLSQIKSGKAKNMMKKQKKISSTSIARLSAINNYKKNLGKKPSGWTNLKILTQIEANEDTKDKYLTKIENSMSASNKLLVNSMKSVQLEKETHSKNPKISTILENNRQGKQSLKFIESKLFPKKKNSKFFSYTYTWLPQPVISNSVNDLLYKRPYKDFREETKILIEQEELQERINNLEEYNEESYLENIAPTTVPLFPIQEDLENDLIIYDENDDGDNFSLIEKEREESYQNSPISSPSKSQIIEPSISYIDGNIVFKNSSTYSSQYHEPNYLITGSESQIIHQTNDLIKNKKIKKISPSLPSSQILSYSEWDNFVEGPDQTNMFKSDTNSYYSKIPDLQSSTSFLSLLEKRQTNNTQKTLKNTTIIMKNSQNISEILENEAAIKKKELNNRSKLRAKSRAKVSMSPSVYRNDLIQEQIDNEIKKNRQKDLQFLNHSQSYALTHNPTLKSDSPEIDIYHDNNKSTFSSTPHSHFHSHHPANPSWSFHDFLATTKPGELANVPRVAQSGFSQSHRNGKPVHLKARFKPFYHSNKGAKIDPLHPYSWH